MKSNVSYALLVLPPYVSGTETLVPTNTVGEKCVEVISALELLARVVCSESDHHLTVNIE